MAKRSPTAMLLALLLGCASPPTAAVAAPTLAQAPGAPSGHTSLAVPTPPSTATPASPPAIVLNFDNADIEAMIQTVSELLGFNYILAPDVRGKVTVRTPHAIRPEDVFSVFLSILEVHGFTVVTGGPARRRPSRPAAMPGQRSWRRARCGSRA